MCWEIFTIFQFSTLFSVDQLVNLSPHLQWQRKNRNTNTSRAADTFFDHAHTFVAFCIWNRELFFFRSFSLPLVRSRCQIVESPNSSERKYNEWQIDFIVVAVVFFDVPLCCAMMPIQSTYTFRSSLTVTLTVECFWRQKSSSMCRKSRNENCLILRNRPRSFDFYSFSRTFFTCSYSVLIRYSKRIDRRLLSTLNRNETAQTQIQFDHPPLWTKRFSVIRTNAKCSNHIHIRQTEKN